MKRLLKKLLKIIGALLLLLLLGFVVLYLVYNKPLPEGTQGADADALAKKMLTAINHDAYENTHYLEWTFKGMHHYQWFKAANKVHVSWKDYRVKLFLSNLKKSEVYKNDVRILGDQEEKIINKAWDYFNNDSYWLVAPFKVFEPNVVRSLVTLEGGEKALLVTHTKGGTTPGDSYLWHLDENGLPIGYDMWVKIIPIGGVKASWDGWKTTESGIKLPTSHKLLFLELDMGEVVAK